MGTASSTLFTIVLNSLYQIPMAAAAAALICWTMRRGPAMHRHAVWVAALLVAGLLPLGTVARLPQTTSAQFTPSPELTNTRTNPGSLQSRAASPSLPIPCAYRILPVPTAAVNALAGAYLIFVIIGLLRLTWAGAQTLQMRSRAYCEENIPQLLRQVWDHCQDSLSVPKAELRFSNSISGPIVAGNVIILPERLLHESSKDVLTTVIGHEMAHVARRDFVRNVVYELLHLPIAFHPAAWWLRSRVVRTREMACDELVVRNLLDARTYAESIVSIAAAMRALPQAGYSLGVFDGDVLEERIRRLLQRPAAGSKRPRAVLAAGLFVLVLFAIFASGFAVTSARQTNSDNSGKERQAAANRQLNTRAQQEVESFQPPSPFERPPGGGQTAERGIRVSEAMAKAHLIQSVEAVYPDIAKRARIEGTAVYEIIVGKDGTVSEVQAVRCHPTLCQAGMDAVRQWQFKPWLINGQPVEVTTQVTIPFKLSPAVESLHLSPPVVAMPPPPPPPPSRLERRPEAGQTAESGIRVSEAMAKAHLMRGVEAAYPDIAKRARIEGTAVYEIFIGKDGIVSEVQAVRCHPTLCQAGMDALRQWQFKPWLINGQPTEVTTQVTLTFKLSQA